MAINERNIEGRRSGEQAFSRTMGAVERRLRAITGNGQTRPELNGGVTDRKVSLPVLTRIPEGPVTDVTARRYYEYEAFHYNYAAIKENGTFGEGQGLDRWLPLLPVSEISVRLPGKVGDTPLSPISDFSREAGFSNVWVKDEGSNPTGSFKDRESAIVISEAVNRGETKVNIISSGNAAVSTAAYAQKAGVECVAYVPEGTTQEKKDLITLYGANIVTIPGFYEDVYRTVADTLEHTEGWNVTTGLNPYRTEGDKTIAFELYEQFGGEAPDTVVIPSGNGGSLAGVWQGFKDLFEIGKIDKLPQMVSVQVKDAAPFEHALRDGHDYTILTDIEDSLAEGIVAGESYCSPKAIRALQESNGYVVTVTDDEIADALRKVIKQESLIPEPTSAAVFAALPKLRNNPDDRIVLLNTGTGQKMPGEIVQILNDHPQSETKASSNGKTEAVVFELFDEAPISTATTEEGLREVKAFDDRVFGQHLGVTMEELEHIRDNGAVLVMRDASGTAIIGESQLLLNPIPEHPTVEPDEAYCYGTAVDPELQGSGIAQKLFSEQERIAKEAGKARMTLTVRVENAKSIRSRMKMGYQITGYDPECYGPIEEGGARLLMSKVLVPEKASTPYSKDDAITGVENQQTPILSESNFADAVKGNIVAIPVMIGDETDRSAHNLVQKVIAQGFTGTNLLRPDEYGGTRSLFIFKKD